METFSILTLFGILLSSYVSVPRHKADDFLEEQSFYSGKYDQTHVYGDGQSVDLGGISTSDIVSFDLNARTHAVLGASLSDYDIDENDLYSPAFDGYEFKKYSDGKYDAFVNDEFNMNGVAWGPKESPSNSTCKLRAYYHDVSFNDGLVTLMYDFTGFLVGDSLLMTAAHGLYRDVTVGDFDDGIDNKYFPGEVEVYGAIGMADTWGTTYTYYAKGTKVFFPSSYATYRSFADDWVLMRLDTPLGRELSYRKLSTAPMDLSGDYRIIGYPSFNQFHLRMNVSSADYVVDSTRPMIEYSVSSQDGMSGSPFYSTADETMNVNVGSDGRSYLATRSAYGMHVCSNVDHTTAYAITFDSQIIELVDSLNSRYMNSSDSTWFYSLYGQPLEEASLPIGGGYDCKVRAQGCSMSAGRLALHRGSSVMLEFPFPLNSISLHSSRSTNNPNLTIGCHSYDEGYDFVSSVEACESEYTISSSGLRSVEISYDDTDNGILYLDYASFGIDWYFSRINYSAPWYDQNESPNGNCVSYAIEGIGRLSSGSVLPKRANGTTLNKLTDYYPGMLIAGLTKALAEEGIEMNSIGKYEICEPDSYKIAIMCDPYRYYHLLRENVANAWSHYLIGNGVKCWDYDNTFIGWPDEARLLHPEEGASGSETYFDLTSFVGYFSIRSASNA